MPCRVPLGLSVALPAVLVAPAVPVPVVVLLAATPVVVLSLVAPLMKAVVFPLAPAVVEARLPEAIPAKVAAVRGVGVGAQPALAWCWPLGAPWPRGARQGVEGVGVARRGKARLLIFPPEVGLLPSHTVHLEGKEEKGRSVGTSAARWSV